MIKAAFSTLGCPKNLVDSETMLNQLISQGFSITEDINETDVLVLNTCGFIDKAKEESVQKIIDYVHIKESREIVIAVVGCLVQRYKIELKKQIPGVDIWLGVGELAKLGDEILRIIPKNRLEPSSNRQLWETKLTPQQYAYIKIADGCNHRCSFCVIPSIKGKYKSRDFNDIVADAKTASLNGAREICVVAQDISSYGHDLPEQFSLSALIKELDKIDNINWIRLMYLYPDNVNDELIKTIAESKKVCAYIDIPFQHLSSKILKSMNRSQTTESIYSLVQKLRANIPGLFIRTSFILGYPGETEEDFNILLQGIKDLKFERLGVFEYSDEEGTKAQSLPDKVPAKTIKKRFAQIMKLQRSISIENHKKLINKELTVIVDAVEEDGTILARTEWDAPEIDCSFIIPQNNKRDIKQGDFIKVCVEKTYDYDLEGRVINEFSQ